MSSEPSIDFTSLAAANDSAAARAAATAQRAALAAELLARRPAILEAWRRADAASVDGSAAASLSRAQFNDHIPAVLDCLGHTIESGADGDDPSADALQTRKVCDHGLQRWQQGYQLRELIREWGHLQIVVAEELERYAAAHPTLERSVMPTARRAWTRLCADGATESATQYWRLHQIESGGHVNDLERALAALHDVERGRAETWRVAAHDLRGSVTVVKGATALLHESGAALPEPMRIEVAEMLNKGVSSLHEMLDDLLSLARLEAGHERRELSRFDAATLLRDFCSASQSTAAARGLFLNVEGPAVLPVEGDRAKVLRILQNLLLNAVKYTQRGGVSVTWGVDTGRDTDRWTFSVQDTGPGMEEADASPLAHELLAATAVADEVRDASADRRRNLGSPETLPSETASSPPVEGAGEGVGLSIVKRLCEMLDASLELATKPGHGTTVRVILPRTYDADAPAQQQPDGVLLRAAFVETA